MTPELFWLTLTALMTALFWAIYVLNRFAARGVFEVLGGSPPEESTDLAPWARRAIRAHHNAIENLAVFAPAVLVAHALNISTPVTVAAAMIYFAARLVHFIVYTLGVPVVRTLAFAAGWGAQLAILASILHWI